MPKKKSKKRIVLEAAISPEVLIKPKKANPSKADTANKKRKTRKRKKKSRS